MKKMIDKIKNIFKKEANTKESNEAATTNKVYFRPCMYPTLEESMSGLLVFNSTMEFVTYMIETAEQYNVQATWLRGSCPAPADIGWYRQYIVRIGEQIIGYFTSEQNVDVKKMNEYLKNIGAKTDGNN